MNDGVYLIKSGKIKKKRLIWKVYMQTTNLCNSMLMFSTLLGVMIGMMIAFVVHYFYINKFEHSGCLNRNNLQCFVEKVSVDEDLFLYY